MTMDASWNRLASRAARVVLARQDMSYPQLAGELTKLGLSESARAVEAKVIRGTFRFSFFLEVLVASQAECPSRWVDVFSSTDTWEARATAVFAIELAARPWLDWRMLSNRLEEIGVSLSADSLQSQIDSGSFLTTLFLQCATVCHFDSALRFLDISSLNEVALAGLSTP